MNYEELLEARNDVRNKKYWLPIGDYYRQQTDGKWRGTVDVRKELHESITFSKALEEEAEKNKTLATRHQLHFDVVKEDGVISQLTLEPGNYMTVEQLLIDNPAVVAQKDFYGDVFKALVDTTTYLHQQGIYHVCFSPKTVFVRKGDNAIMLLSHGSFYFGLKDQRAFYGKCADFVAPEVLDRGTIDERCDVYSIAKFMTAICDTSDIPLEYRQAYKKAASESPEDRYASPQAMMAAIRSRHNTFNTLRALIIAGIIAAICVGIFFEMVPETEQVEFVKPAPRQATDDLLDDGFSPDELGVASDGDSLVPDADMERAYQAKAEEIFRKRYEKEADRVLSKIYNKNYMNNSEKKFMTESENTVNELMRLQNELGAEAGLTPERSQLVASSIIERITNQKKKAMGGTNSRGVQTPDAKK
jgi:serine/threonine protein kinase